MATKKVKQKVQETSGIATALRPNHDEYKFVGEEPEYTVITERKVQMARGFNWYNKFYNRKDAKEFIIKYLEKHDHELLKGFRKVADSNVNMTYGWLARMTDRGLVLLPDEQATLHQVVKTLIESQPKEKPKKVEAEPVAKPNIQEIMLDKAKEAGGELEGLFDQFLMDGPKLNHALKPIDELSKKNVLHHHVPMLIDCWNKKLVEFTLLADGKDTQLNDGYKQFSKIQVRHIIKFIELVLSDLNSYITVKKATKAVRVRKPVSVEKQVAGMKYLKEFKDLKLTSLHPSKLIGSSEAWVYDTATRRMHHYVADEYSKVFSVKGTTLLGFDTVNSEVKTLRKPAEQLKEMLGSKPAARKFFKEISTVPTTPSGRFNENMIILKAF